MKDRTWKLPLEDRWYSEQETKEMADYICELEDERILKELKEMFKDRE